MQVSLGHSAKGAEPVVYDTDKLINPHIVVVGDTGAGKTTFLRRVIYDGTRLSATVPRVHVFDVHGDIDIPGASEVKFSESTDYGFNPLELSTDSDFGGVRKRIQTFMNALNRTSHKLGHKQEAVLRNLLTDLYAARGFHMDDPDSWREDLHSHIELDDDKVYVESAYEERKAVFDAGGTFDHHIKAYWFPKADYQGKATRWPPKRFGKTYPTLQDLVSFADQKLSQIFFGVPQVAMRKLEEFYVASRSLHTKRLAEARKAGGFGSNENIERMEKMLGTAKEKVVDAFIEHVNSVATGHELNNYIKYDSIDVLKSVVDRLKNLNAIGIFRSTPPPFDPKNPVWTCKINPLGDDEKGLFVEFRLEQLFARALQRGMQKTIRDLIIVDEGHLFVSNDKDHIINKIIKEGRKFGLGLVMASQAPDHFSKDLLSGVATKVILGLDKSYFTTVESRMGINQTALGFVQARKRLVVLFKRSGEQSQVVWVNIDRRDELLN